MKKATRPPPQPKTQFARIPLDNLKKIIGKKALPLKAKPPTRAGS